MPAQQWLLDANSKRNRFLRIRNLNNPLVRLIHDNQILIFLRAIDIEINGTGAVLGQMEVDQVVEIHIRDAISAHHDEVFLFSKIIRLFCSKTRSERPHWTGSPRLALPLLSALCTQYL